MEMQQMIQWMLAKMNASQKQMKAKMDTSTKAILATHEIMNEIKEAMRAETKAYEEKRMAEMRTGQEAVAARWPKRETGVPRNNGGMSGVQAASLRQNGI
ncbi:hypothetical protein B7P43_G10218 [Cryptotermes secundus]|uniref:Uncharacterized protein n=1 Tax=Cryptotermes secundus TaxID=105785 RepID=A0A2J7QYW9_9NEOP|nr:hypothetical protein B7P43_G10218 [Cryptotermes secundus]